MAHAKTQEERQQRREGHAFVLFNSVYIITPGTLQTDNKWLQNEWLTNRKVCLEGNFRVGEFRAAVACTGEAWSRPQGQVVKTVIREDAAASWDVGSMSGRGSGHKTLGSSLWLLKMLQTSRIWGQSLNVLVVRVWGCYWVICTSENNVVLVSKEIS